MKDIKYKVFHKHGDLEMPQGMYGVCMIFQGDDDEIIEISVYPINGGKIKTVGYKYDNENFDEWSELLPFIGLYDDKCTDEFPNGHPIYESDIVRYCQCYNEEDDEVENTWETTSIEWCGDRDYPAFDLADHDFEENGLSALRGYGYRIEVISDIYQNPELLK